MRRYGVTLIAVAVSACGTAWVPTQHFDGGSGVVCEGNRALVFTHDGWFSVAPEGDHASVGKVVTLTNAPKAIAQGSARLQGDRLVLAGPPLRVFDLGADPVTSGEAPCDGAFALLGHVLYVSEAGFGVAVYDVSDVTRPRKVTQFAVNDDNQAPYELLVVKNTLVIIAANRTVIELRTLADPFMPALAGRANITEAQSPGGVLFGPMAAFRNFVTITISSVNQAPMVLNIADPAHPVFTQGYVDTAKTGGTACQIIPTDWNDTAGIIGINSNRQAPGPWGNDQASMGRIEVTASGTARTVCGPLDLYTRDTANTYDFANDVCLLGDKLLQYVKRQNRGQDENTVWVWSH